MIAIIVAVSIAPPPRRAHQQQSRFLRQEHGIPAQIVGGGNGNGGVGNHATMAFVVVDDIGGLLGLFHGVQEGG